jgi:hypothetical protein
MWSDFASAVQISHHDRSKVGRADRVTSLAQLLDFKDEVVRRTHSRQQGKAVRSGHKSDRDQDWDRGRGGTDNGNELARQPRPVRMNQGLSSFAMPASVPSIS